jgi:septal ring factor EnvC (AmiA/AmiB activator)
VESFKLSREQSRTVSLGCGTLLLIALIVAVFSRSNTHDVDEKLDALRNDVKQLQKSIDGQTQQIRELTELLKKREPAAKTAEALPKN